MGIGDTLACSIGASVIGGADVLVIASDMSSSDGNDTFSRFRVASVGFANVSRCADSSVTSKTLSFDAFVANRAIVIVSVTCLVLVNGSVHASSKLANAHHAGSVRLRTNDWCSSAVTASTAMIVDGAWVIIGAHSNVRWGDDTFTRGRIASGLSAKVTVGIVRLIADHGCRLTFTLVASLSAQVIGLVTACGAISKRMVIASSHSRITSDRFTFRTWRTGIITLASCIS